VDAALSPRPLDCARRRRGPPRLPDGRRVYAIGDVHGRADLLARLLDMIAADRAARPGAQVDVVLTGDYIDRGPHSHLVLERLADLAETGEAVALRGNHEALMLGFYEAAVPGPGWLRLGGAETLHGYGVDAAAARRGRNLPAAAAALRERLPARHVELLRRMPLSWSLGDYFFCHAGVRPGVPLAAQSGDDLLWIREAFLRSRADFGKVVVHGHTPVRRPELRANRINLDTGAYASHCLTCLVLEGTEQRFLWT
jgi:serine/threonine protein phosphatase 1